MRTNICDLLAERATASPDAPALTYRDRTVTYADTWALVERCASQLRQVGVVKGNRVAVYLDKRIETVVAFMAVAAEGAIFVPINHVLKPGQVAHILRDSGARLLITSPDRFTQLTDELGASAVQGVLLVGSTAVDNPSAIPVDRWNEPIKLESGIVQSASRTIDQDPAAILYTSGSTGLPKGVVLSHRNLIVGAESVSSYLGMGDSDVVLSVLPLSFDAGLSQVTTSFSVGAHCVLMNYLLPHDVPRLCTEHGVTALTCVPPLWLQLLSVKWPESATQSLRLWANTGGRMPRATLDRLRATFDRARPFLMYGLTEAFRSTYLDPDEVDRRPDSIGKAIPNAEVLVLRPDGSRCEPDEPGELVHRGALVSLGYWNDALRTAERFKPVAFPGQDWRAPELAVWSGDVAVTDDDGFIYFVGRNDDMIKTSGYRVSPTEIEEAAYSTGLVRDAVAIGVDDPALGQSITLVVTSQNGQLDTHAMTAALRKRLPLYMVPACIDVREKLPMSPNGKFDRSRIRLEAAQ